MRFGNRYILLVLVLSGFLLGSGFIAGGRKASFGRFEVLAVHRVDADDTLWGIAKEYHPDKDTLEVIDHIREANGLKGGSGPLIRVGQRIVIPKM